MQLKILGSSSAGNCYIFDNGNECLLLECGVHYRDIQVAVDFDMNKISGCLVSHEHGDHIKSISKVLGARIPCYMSKGTARALNIEGNALVTYLEEFKSCRLGGFTIQGFAVQHDAEEPFGYLIHHKEMGTVLLSLLARLSCLKYSRLAILFSCC